MTLNFQGFQQPQYGSEAQGPTSGTGGVAVADAAVPEPASKGPLPPEHQVIQDVIDEVRNRCLSVVQNQVRLENLLLSLSRKEL